MGKDVNPQKRINRVYRGNCAFILGFFVSLGIIALGQPARLGILGAVAAVFGFTLFFNTLPSTLSKRNRLGIGALWFAAVQLVQLSWMTSIEFQGYYILVIYGLLVLGLACQFGLLTLLIPAEGKIPISKWIFCSALWTLMEWLRLFFFCGFSWNPIGLALTHFTPALQFSSLFGVFGMSFWVMLTNLWGIHVWRMGFKMDQILYWIALACTPYLFGSVHLFYHSEGFKKEQNKLNIALVQTALLPTEKVPHVMRMEEFVAPFDQWRRIIHSLKEKQKMQWDLIVLPEAAVPMLSDLTYYPYEMILELLISEYGFEVIKKCPPLVYPYAEEKNTRDNSYWYVSNLFLCQTLSNYYEAEMVVGLDHSERNGGKNFNSAFYLKPNHITHERYDKQILLPLAEYLPFDVLRPLTKSYGIFDFFTRGDGSKVFGKKLPFSVAICYEETFSEIMREGRDKGAKLFINVSNDNYYPDSTLHEQHFYHARLRTVENGTPLIRSCNSGVTGSIDSLGRILNRFETQNSQSQEGVLSCSLTMYQYSTLFSFWGEAGIISICLIIIFTYCRVRYHSSLLRGKPGP